MYCNVFAGEAKHESSMSERTAFFVMNQRKTLLRWNDMLSFICRRKAAV